MEFDYTEEPWRTQAYHLIRELVGASVMSLEGEDRESWNALDQFEEVFTLVDDEGERARLLAHTVYEAVGLIDEILLEAATAQVRSSEHDAGTSVATDPFSLAPEILQRRRQLWQTLMEREPLD